MIFLFFFLKLNLFGYHPVTKVKLDSKLEVHKDVLLKEATEIAWKVKKVFFSVK